MHMAKVVFLGQISLDKGVSELILKENPGRWTLGPSGDASKGDPGFSSLTHPPSPLSGWADGSPGSSRDSWIEVVLVGVSPDALKRWDAFGGFMGASWLPGIRR